MYTKGSTGSRLGRYANTYHITYLPNETLSCRRILSATAVTTPRLEAELWTVALVTTRVVAVISPVILYKVISFQYATWWTGKGKRWWGHDWGHDS